MISNRQTDILFQLVKSLEKAEKRHFKLYIRRNSSREDLKIVALFDALDKMKEYDERVLLKKLPSIGKPQLANLKTHLYKQILASLRLLKSADSIDLQLNEQFDYAHILYKKGLFYQSLRLLDRAKEIARAHQKYNSLIQVLSLEKRIEGLYITRSLEHRAEQLAAESTEVSQHIEMVARLSNLSLQLYSWYTRHGHARNEKDQEAVDRFLKDNLPVQAFSLKGFYERLYLYQAYSWYAFIRQDFLKYYRYTRKWVSLFEEEPLMVRVETGHYIKGLHNLLNAHFDLKNDLGFEKSLAQLQSLSETPRVREHDNFRIQSFIYISLARLNQHFMQGNFKDGLPLVQELEEKIRENSLFMDRHRVLVLHYKIALLYFGAGDYNRAIDFLQKIIQEPADLRIDLHSYARLLHLLAHYELGNHMLMEPLTKSVFRYMAKMQNLTVIEREIFRFLKQSFQLNSRQLKPELEKFLEDIRHLEKNKYESRSLAYLDIISWLEGKVQNKPMSQVIHEKYLERSRQRAMPRLIRRA